MLLWADELSPECCEVEIAGVELGSIPCGGRGGAAWGLAGGRSSRDCQLDRLFTEKGRRWWYIWEEGWERRPREGGDEGERREGQGNGRGSQGEETHEIDRPPVRLLRFVPQHSRPQRHARQTSVHPRRSCVTCYQDTITWVSADTSEPEWWCCRYVIFEHLGAKMNFQNSKTQPRYVDQMRSAPLPTESLYSLYRLLDFTM